MKSRLIPLVLFSIGFAFVEATVVVYLRQILGFGQAFQIPSYNTLLNLGFITFISPHTPILGDVQYNNIELARESFTMIMLGSVAYLTGNTLSQKIGAFLAAFSVWDIFYYLFLRILSGWPKSLLDQDIYFLIPVPWIGPVITPLVIFSILFIIGLKLLNTSNPRRI